MDIGARIKQLRIKNDLTLEELASRTELTKGFLSQLERNLASPSVQTLADIVEVLGTSMSQFFAAEVEEKVVFGVKDAFVDEQDDQTIHWIVPNAQKNCMEPIILELQPKAKSKMIEPHDGEEMAYILSGKVRLYRQGHKKGISVKKNETFYIKGSESHYIENIGDKTAVVLWISTPPIF